MSGEDRYVFIVEWYDQQACLIWQYNLTYFLADNTIDMFDTKNRRVFLKRTEIPGLSAKDLYIGSTLTVYSWQLVVKEYADLYTRTAFETKREKTYAMIKPDAYLNIGKIINRIQEEGF